MENDTAFHVKYMPYNFQFIRPSVGHDVDQASQVLKRNFFIPLIDPDKRYYWNTLDINQKLKEYKKRVPFAPVLSFLTNNIYDPVNPVRSAHPSVFVQEAHSNQFNRNNNRGRGGAPRRTQVNLEGTLEHVTFYRQMEIASDGTPVYKLDLNYVLLKGIDSVSKIAEALYKAQTSYQSWVMNQEIKTARGYFERQRYLEKWNAITNCLTPEQLEEFRKLPDRTTEEKTFQLLDIETIKHMVDVLKNLTVSFPCIQPVPETASEYTIIEKFLPCKLQKTHAMNSTIFRTDNDQVYINIFALGYNRERLIRLILQSFQTKHTRERPITVGIKDPKNPKNMMQFNMKKNPRRILKIPNPKYIDPPDLMVMLDKIPFGSISSFDPPMSNDRSNSDNDTNKKLVTLFDDTSFDFTHAIHEPKNIIIDEDIEEYFGRRYAMRNGLDPEQYLPGNVEQAMKDKYNTCVYLKQHLEMKKKYIKNYMAEQQKIERLTKSS